MAMMVLWFAVCIIKIERQLNCSVCICIFNNSQQAAENVEILLGHGGYVVKFYYVVGN